MSVFDEEIKGVLLSVYMEDKNSNTLKNNIHKTTISERECYKYLKDFFTFELISKKFSNNGGIIMSGYVSLKEKNSAKMLLIRPEYKLEQATIKCSTSNLKKKVNWLKNHYIGTAEHRARKDRIKFRIEFKILSNGKREVVSLDLGNTTKD